MTGLVVNTCRDGRVGPLDKLREDVPDYDLGEVGYTVVSHHTFVLRGRPVD